MNIEKIQAGLTVETATFNDYPTIQNMARFYVYELSRDCGFISDDWALPSSGLYESFDFKNYFEETTRKAFLIKVDHELAGFALLNQDGVYRDTLWNMGEFFITAKFQGKGLGRIVASKLLSMHLGSWEVSVIPQNQGGLSFWRKTIAQFTQGLYQEEIKTIDYDSHQPLRVIFCFNSSSVQHPEVLLENPTEYQIQWVDELDSITEQHMNNEFIAYEAQHGIAINYRRFSVILSAKQGKILGAINAYTAFSEIYVDDIWVDSAHRGKGYGRQLLHALEQGFKGQGFNNINLVTSAFQAPEFYKKCGFQEEFTRINKNNPKLSKTFFVKFFNEEAEKQGILLDYSE